jgi:hypothetical protein
MLLFAISIALVTILPHVFEETFSQPPSLFTWSYTPNSFAISSLKAFVIIFFYQTYLPPKGFL